MKAWFKKVFGSVSIPYIWNWSKKEHKFVLITSIINVLYAGLSLWFSLTTKELVDAAVGQNTNNLIKYAIMLAVFILIQLLFSYIISRLNAFIRARMQKTMRRDVLNEILKKEYKEISAFHSGELVNRMFSDVSNVIDGVTSIVPPLLCMITQLVGAIIILSRLDYRFVLVLCGVGLISLVLTLLFKGKMKRMHKDVQTKEGLVHASLQETVENTKIVKASNSEEYVKAKVDTNLENHYDSQMKRNRFTSVAGTGLRGVFSASWLFAIIWGCFGIASGTYSYGTLMAIMQLVGQIQSPFKNLSGTLQQIYGTISSAERLLDIYNLTNEEKEEVEKVDAEELYKELKEIKISNLNFGYGREEDVLNDVNVSLHPGDFIAFTGLSGGGKSTLFLLLLGIYKPINGSIEFIENDLVENASKKTRSLFAYVPQGNALFSGTLRENLMMFNENASEKELYEALAVADINTFVDELADGLDTVLGERGIGLSEGQAQRIAIARAIVSKAPILLLDEASSALDESTEARVLENISKLQNKTCFIVTHRKAAFKICNRRLHIENSRLEELPLED